MVVDIRDQLGNQMFTYAATKCICKESGKTFQWFSNGTTIINSFDEKLGNQIDGGAFPNIDLSERIAPIENPKYDWQEPWPRKKNYSQEVYGLSDESLVRGHFQCETYFIKYRDRVLNWYRLNDSVMQKATKKNNAIRNKYPKSKLVSIHLRRGWDYVVGGRLISQQYYIDAVQTLKEATPDQLVLVLFSDVPVKQNLIKKLGCAVEIVRGSLFEDLALMTLCDYHIISNSTFAWWGAWLDPKETIVVRPSIYPISPKLLYPDDIFPSKWIAVEAKREYNSFKVFWGQVKRKIFPKRK